MEKTPFGFLPFYILKSEIFTLVFLPNEIQKPKISLDFLPSYILKSEISLFLPSYMTKKKRAPPLNLKIKVSK